MTKQKYSTLTVPFEKSKIVSFAYSIIKKIAEPYALSRLPVKIICCINFGSASGFWCLLKSIAIKLWYFLK